MRFVILLVFRGITMYLQDVVLCHEMCISITIISKIF